MPKGKWIAYSAAEWAWLEANSAMVISDYHAAFVATFQRDDVSLKNLHSLRKRKGWRTGRTGHFPAGQVPHNKGKRCEEGKGGRHPNARRTQFAKGSLSGRARDVIKPLGHERLSKEGYLERKINNDLPFKNRWRAVHLINWEALNGPLPAGHCLKCMDGDKLNTDPSNWELISRGVLSRLNGGRWKTRLKFDDAHPEVKPTVLALALVEQARHERTKGTA